MLIVNILFQLVSLITNYFNCLSQSELFQLVEEKEEEKEIQ